MWRCKEGHVWKQSDGDICPECPTLTCDTCSHVWYTRQGNLCPNCPKWECAECNHQWYKRDSDKCPKCLPKWRCSECDYRWYKKDGDECPKCPINLDLSPFKQKFNEIVQKQDSIQYFESEVITNISKLLSKYENMEIKEREIDNEDTKQDEKEPESKKDKISYDDHLRLAVICHSVEEYQTCQDHLRQALQTNPGLNVAIEPFEEYGYVQFDVHTSKYIENDINEIIQNGTNDIKICDSDNDEEKQENKEEKYDEKEFKENLPYHHFNGYKKKIFEESKIYKNGKWRYCGGILDDCNRLDLNFAHRICGKEELQKYISKFVYFKICDQKKVNETFLREIIGINNDEHIEEILNRLRTNIGCFDNEEKKQGKKLSFLDILEEMKKYHDHMYEIENRSHQIQQIMTIFDECVSKVTATGKALENEKEVCDFINEMKIEEEKIKQLLDKIKKNKISEKLQGLIPFILTIHNIKSIKLINEEEDIKLLNKSYDRIRTVYLQSYLYHIQKKTKMYLKIFVRSFALLNYVTDEELEQFIKELQEAKECGFEKETESYFEMIEEQIKLRNVVKTKTSSFVSMVGKFSEILKNQYHRDRLSAANEMANVQLNDVNNRIRVWSVTHKKQKQQRENVENYIKERIDEWNQCIAPNIPENLQQIMQKQKIENKEFFNNLERHIHAIFGNQWNGKLKEEFMHIVFVSLLIKFSSK